MHNPSVPASPLLVSAHKIAIAGLGLIGGSIARRLVAHNRFVVAWNHHARPYEAAERVGIHCVDTLEQLVEGKPDVLILAVPLESMDDVLTRIAPHLHRGTTLTDVGSVKGPVRAAVVRAGLGEYYVGAHPMAGNELSGFEASDAALLDRALWALTFDDTTDFSRFLTVADVVTKGLENSLIAVDDDTHDRAAALISHMPHVVSTAMANELVEAKFADPAVAVALSAGSWRDMTRVSLTDPDRTRAMVELDARNVADLLESMSARLARQAAVLRGQLQGETNDFAQSRQFFAASQPFRDYKARETQIAEGTLTPQRINRMLTDADWRAELLTSARAGERVVEFRTTHEMTVERRPFEN
ncbi:MAG: prephenate dehydrogenase/arogenate dehydrogenase family protein [Bifidobacteriaceae bacterium]|nr:prephenate dehydrogenase/arogenate dehydrogenase family protein [Bifidobacteriaceae bacterium]